MIAPVSITGIGKCVPEKVVTNDDLAQLVETSDEWISKRTGIRSRHIAVEETAISLAVSAAKDAPIRPATISEAMTGPSSRVMDSTTTFATAPSALKRAKPV